MKAVRGGRGSRYDGKREVLEEPVWRELEFSQEANEVLNYPQQNHANKKNNRRSWQSI